MIKKPVCIGGICEFAIAIRTFFISGDVGYIQACGGVVLDSRADGEYTEIVRKLAAQEAVLQYFTHSI
jgi:anthranilate synthase component 1